LYYIGEECWETTADGDDDESTAAAAPAAAADGEA